MFGFGVNSSFKKGFEHFLKKEYSLALPLLEKASGKNHSDAKACLALMYLNGLGVTKNNALAVQYLSDLTDISNCELNFSIGELYYRGNGVAKDIALSAFYFKKSADGGYVPAMFQYGHMQCSGEIENHDSHIGFEYIEKAANNNAVFAKYYLGLLYKQGVGTQQSYKDAFYWFYKAGIEDAQQDAMVELGLLYESGLGTVKNPREAMDCYITAMLNGNILGIYNLARVYETGATGIVAYPEAIDYYKKAILAGCPEAMYRFGRMFLDGRGFLKLPQHGKYWIERSISLGCAEAIEYAKNNNLEEYYLNNTIIPLSDVEDLALIDQALQNGYRYSKEGVTNLPTICSVANFYFMYEQGNGDYADHKIQELFQEEVGEAELALACYYIWGLTNKNLDLGHEHTKISAELGCKDSFLALALQYELGNGTEVSLEKAKIWYRRAIENGYINNSHVCIDLAEFLAKQGNLNAMKALAEGYEYGTTLPKDPSRAFHYYCLAADKQDLYAYFKVGKCMLFGEGTRKSQAKGFAIIKLCADANVADAAAATALCYISGWGVAISKKKATEYAYKALELGNEPVKDLIQQYGL